MTVNDFMDTMMSDPGPPCLVWLPLLHRLASVETGKLAFILSKLGSITPREEYRVKVFETLLMHIGTREMK